MEHFHPNWAGDSARPCKSFFLCSLRFLLLIHFLSRLMDLPFEGGDCFEAGRPAVVSAQDFLSQLL
jgi:hypothetical protein